MIKTERIFKQDVYAKEAEAVITGIIHEGDKTALTLDRTIFFPEGGGQSADKGKIGRYSLIDCQERDNDIYHYVDEPDGNFDLTEGGTVKLELDWEHRFDNMQRHCGEHILTGIFDREYGGVNRGFHMGDDYMTVDISMEKDPNYKTVTWEMCQNAELLANELIWQDEPMLVRHFDTYEDAKDEPMRKPLTIKEDISLVGIGSRENGWSCVMCCGTHPSTCGQVGMIKIFKVEPNKGMYRIYFEAGRRAFLKYQEEMNTMHLLARRLSSGENDMVEKYDAQADKQKEKNNRLYQLTKEVLHREASDIVSGDVKKYEILSLDDIVTMTKELTDRIEKICFLVHVPSNTVFLVSNGKVDCGKLVKENAGIYNGKGGGSPTVARAIFNKAEYVDVFIDLIQKHLREQ